MFVCRRLNPVGRVLLVTMVTGLGLWGCTGISIQPSCPKELTPGESGPVKANQHNEGAIAKYTWEVFPSDAGAIEDPAIPATMFEAVEVGEVTIRLTASDGLYQVISQCVTEVVSFTEVTLSLAAEPDSPEVGDEVTLRCTTERLITSITRTVEQTAGGTVELNVVAEGVVTFTPSVGDDYTFRCVAQNAAGDQAESDLLTVAVPTSPDDPDNGNDNGSDRPDRRSLD
ncbi:MAG: hypothetical protein JSU63_02375 [Phycisphaerales bacterium]|nr:MAG: hypothetical protein JSU63_02375 [Phycisphaerales bacterium]